MLELQAPRRRSTTRLGKKRSRGRATATVYGDTDLSGVTVLSENATRSGGANQCSPLGRANASGAGGRLGWGPTTILARCAGGPRRFGPELVSILALGVAVALLLGGCSRGASSDPGKAEGRGHSQERRSGGDEATPGLPDKRGGSDEGSGVPGEAPPGSGSGEGREPEDGSSGGEPRGAGVARRLDPEDVDLRGGALVVRPSSDVRNPLPHAIEGYSTEDGPAGGESRLLVFYWGGVEDCWRLAKVDSKETTEEVVVTVYEGSPAALPPGTACLEMAVLKVVEVDLMGPLGDRRVLDGAVVSR